MKIFRSFEEAAGIPSPVITTGTFDGVHTGHKTILRRLKRLAAEHGGESALITFDPHPRAVLYPDTIGKGLRLICSGEEKIELLSKAGLDNLIIIEFTREFSHVTAESFVRDILTGILGAKVIVVGQNHHFGFNQDGDYKKLWEWRGLYGFEAEEIPMQEVMHETVSSTRIRQALSEGYIQRANAYLDHFYIIIGSPLKEETRLSPDIRFMTLPLTERTKLVPPPGLYAVSCAADAFYSKGMVFIPEGVEEIREIFLHLVNYEDNLTGKRMTLFFHKNLSAFKPGHDPVRYLGDGVREMEELIY